MKVAVIEEPPPLPDILPAAPEMPPPVPSAPSAPPAPPPQTNLWAAIGAFALASVLWLVATDPSETGAGLIGFWLGGIMFCLVLGYLVAGVFAIMPPLRRRFAGRLRTVAFWASAVFMLLSALGQNA